MPFVPAPNCVQINMRFTQVGKPTEMTFAAHLETTPTQEEAQAVADALDTLVAEGLLALLPPPTIYVETYVRGLSAEEDVEAVANAETGEGTLSGTPLPNNVTLAIARQTGATGRSRRGRVYWPGISEVGLESQNTVSEDYAAPIVTWLNLIKPALGDVGFTEVLISRQHNLVPLNPAVFYAISGYAVRNRHLDTQRRRIQRVSA